MIHRRYILPVLASLAFCFLAGCRTIPAATDEQPSARMAEAPPQPTPSATPKTPPIVADLSINGVRTGTRESQVIKLLGKPQRAKAGRYDNCADGYHRELNYDGLLIDLISDKHRQNLTVTRMDVNSGNWEIAPGVHIGDPISKIQQMYGEPDSLYDGEWGYRVKGNDGWVAFFEMDGKIIRVTTSEPLC